MEIILLENIDHVGRVGERVTVKPGYARNYLFPQGKAAVVTPENLARFEARRAELEAKAAGQVEKAQIRAEAVQGRVIRIQANAGPGGKLFGSVGATDIARACEALDLAVERNEIRLPDGPIRVAGEHTVELHLRAGVNVQFTVLVEGGPTRGSAVGERAERVESGDSAAADAADEKHPAD